MKNYILIYRNGFCQYIRETPFMEIPDLNDFDFSGIEYHAGLKYYVYQEQCMETECRKNDVDILYHAHKERKHKERIRLIKRILFCLFWIAWCILLGLMEGGALF